MNKIKQRITDLRCEITAITTQRESLDAMQQLELFGLKERLRELESIASTENENPIDGNELPVVDLQRKLDQVNDE